MIRRFVKKGSQGFTLIELMIVVAIVGILAVLAVYGVRKYLADAKTAEAKNSLGAMAKDEVAAYEKESMAGTVLAAGGVAGSSRNLCAQTSTSSAGVPATISKIQGQKYQSQPSDWAPTADLQANSGFACLKFAMDDPQYYQYKYTATAGSTWTGTATGDLDNNSTFSTFSITGNIVSGVLNNAPNLTIVNEDE